MPTFDGGDDFIWVGFPVEWLGVEICILEEAVDGGLEIDDGAEHATLEAPFGQLCEEAFDRIDPRRRCGRKMKDEAGMTIQPFSNFRVLVGAIVIENDVDELTCRNGGLYGVEKADELLMPMTLHTFSDDFSFQHVESGKQGRGAVAFVVVGHGSAPAWLQRQTRLSAVERLDLAFLVHRQDDGVGRRINVQADDVSDLGGKLRIVGQFKLTPAVRLQAVGTPDALDRTDADAHQPGHGRRRPMRHFARRIGGDGQRYHSFGNLGGEGRNARRPRLVPQETVHAFLHEPLLPTPDDRFALAGPAHDFDGPKSVGGQQHDPRSPDVLLRAVAVPGHRFQAAAVGSANLNDDSFKHPADSHIKRFWGIPCGTLMSDFVH